MTYDDANADFYEYQSMNVHWKRVKGCWKISTSMDFNFHFGKKLH